MHHNRGAVAHVIISPYFFEQFFPGKNNVGIHCQKFQKLKFSVWKTYLSISLKNFPAVDQDPKILHLDLLGSIRPFVGKFLHHPLILAQVCVHSRHQFRRIKRLGNIIIRSQSKATHLIHGFCTGSYHKNGNIHFITDLPADLVATFSGKHQIQKHKVKLLLLCDLRRVHSI